MKRIAFGLCVLLLLGGAIAFAQELAILGNGGATVTARGYHRLGTSVYFEMEGSTADAFEFQMRADPTADTNYIWPATVGSSGQQLQTDGVAGATQLSWASAASSRDFKTLEGRLDPRDALAAVTRTPIYRFHYKPDAAMSTGDFATQYVGFVGEEAPQFMHHSGRILNPISTAGYAFAAIQAQQAQIDALRAEIAALRTGR